MRKKCGSDAAKPQSKKVRSERSVGSVPRSGTEAGQKDGDWGPGGRDEWGNR